MTEAFVIVCLLYLVSVSKKKLEFHFRFYKLYKLQFGLKLFSIHAALELMGSVMVSAYHFAIAHLGFVSVVDKTKHLIAFKEIVTTKNDIYLAILFISACWISIILLWVLL